MVAAKAVQDSLGRPKKASKRLLQSSKGFKKVDPKMGSILTTFWCTFGAHLEAILGLKSIPEGDQKCDQFWTLPPAAPRGGLGGRVVSP